jgi:hypothetical protein
MPNSLYPQVMTAKTTPGHTDEIWLARMPLAVLF